MKIIEMKSGSSVDTVWMDRCEDWNIYVDFLWISLSLVHVNVLGVQNSSKASFISVHWKKSVLICSSQSPSRQEVAARGQFIIFQLSVSNFFWVQVKILFSQILVEISQPTHIQNFVLISVGIFLEIIAILLLFCQNWKILIFLMWIKGLNWHE